MKTCLRFLFFLSSVCLAISCKPTSKTSASPQADLPSCIQRSIEAFSKNSCEKGLVVQEYVFHNKRVFVFDQNKCGNDMTSEVLDKDCKSLGFLGGFVGNVNIEGEDFSNAVFVKTVWEKQ